MSRSLFYVFLMLIYSCIPQKYNPEKKEASEVKGYRNPEDGIHTYGIGYTYSDPNSQVRPKRGAQPTHLCFYSEPHQSADFHGGKRIEGLVYPFVNKDFQRRLAKELIKPLNEDRTIREKVKEILIGTAEGVTVTGATAVALAGGAAGAALTFGAWTVVPIPMAIAAAFAVPDALKQVAKAGIKDSMVRDSIGSPNEGVLAFPFIVANIVPAVTIPAVVGAGTMYFFMPLFKRWRGEREIVKEDLKTFAETFASHPNTYLFGEIRESNGTPKNFVLATATFHDALRRMQTNNDFIDKRFECALDHTAKFQVGATVGLDMDEELIDPEN